MTNDNGPRATMIADQVGQVGQRLPDVFESVRDGAIEGARTIQALPDVNQRLLAAFSLGLGLGLSESQFDAPSRSERGALARTTKPGNIGRWRRLATTARFRRAWCRVASLQHPCKRGVARGAHGCSQSLPIVRSRRAPEAGPRSPGTVPGPPKNRGDPCFVRSCLR